LIDSKIKRIRKLTPLWSVLQLLPVPGVVPPALSSGLALAAGTATAKPMIAIRVKRYFMLTTSVGRYKKCGRVILN